MKSELLRTMTCLDEDTSVVELQATSEAYFSILNSTLTRISEDVLATVQTESLADRSPAGIQQRLYAILRVIAATFKTEKKPVFMGKLCLELAKQDLVLSDLKKTAQLVFILFGALTMLYTPIPDP